MSRLVIDSFSIYAAEWHSLNVQSVFISVETFAQYNDKLPISTIFMTQEVSTSMDSYAFSYFE